MVFENAPRHPRFTSAEEMLRAVSDPASSVVALPSRNRPKRRRHASRLLAKDLALMPVANSEDRGQRVDRSKPLAQRPKRRSALLAYLSTVIAAVALGFSVATATIGNGSYPAASSTSGYHPLEGQMTARIVRPL